MKRFKIKPLMSNRLTATIGAALLVVGSSHAAEFDIGNSGWKASIGFQLQAFIADLDTTTKNADGTVTTNDTSQRILSGFDPSKLTVGVTAPEVNGLTVSGTYQLVQAINGAKSSGDNAFNDADGGQFQVRIAELALSGDFGTIKAGRGWAIFGSSSLIHDTGSLPGVGRHGGGLTDAGGGSGGRIDYGYYYPDFHAGVQYLSNDYSGITFRVGIFDPINGVNDESNDLRFEGEVIFSSSAFDLWFSLIDSSTEGADEQSGFDLGGEVRIGSTAVTAALSDGDGILCCAPDREEMQQWYIEIDHTAGKTTFGGSYGENDRDNAAGDISEGELVMLFVHYNVTPELILLVEVNNESVTNAAGVETLDADTIAFGANWQF